MNEELELRMYFFTIYQLTGIQKGIQCGHAALEYAKKYGDTEQYNNFINDWKTWIILNGGVTNDDWYEDENSLNYIGNKLLDNGISFSYFREPDLNNALTSICFLVDERVFNKKKYPDFNEWVQQFNMNSPDFNINEFEKKWEAFVGGPKNVFLRDLLRGKKMA